MSKLTAVLVCDLCLSGAGGECHTPGCALWMNLAPDVPISPAVLAESPLDDPAAMARATEALQVSGSMPHDRRAHYVVSAALHETRKRS